MSEGDITGGTGARGRSRLRLPRIGRGHTGVRGRGREAVESWRRYRETQLTELAESNRLQRELIERTHAPAAQATLPGLTGVPAEPGPTPVPAPGPVPAAAEEPVERRRELMMVTSPFMFGFFGALGVLVAWWLAQNLTRLSSVITFVMIAVFLTLALNPIVESLTRRGLARATGVFTVFLGMIIVLGLFSWLVVPPIVQETSTLIERAPRYLEDLNAQPWVAQLDARYDLGSRLEDEFEKRLGDTNFISTVFGGVLGAAGWLAGGLIGAFTALVLTLYFLAALPTVKDAAYKIVPLSRRARVIGLAEEIMRRVGGYALGQVAVASINGTCSWIMMSLLDVPYAAVLAVLVGMLGLIPLVGATLGAVLVALVALSQGWVIALIVCIYYLIYQQIENYVIVPRIMSRTVSVPGAVTVVAVLAGGTLMGVLGALIAIPVAAGLLLLYNEVVIPRQARL
ncbi:AI-2E family transporter [Ornithinimicrobium cavernae]|uniref:AI-2E family transporter n=1 Tax=Ornithinimicrobium cavernae TaxID=2666047 RepID=UPI001F1F72D3|nr:AI-2E family transporter [Ornithinimicrobium cavernae]